ncbi:MAG: hypothetical protein J2P19_03800 [Pseudonocardia sp.]|nr:hypothetical protein [Pseudonocardia sp.]
MPWITPAWQPQTTVRELGADGAQRIADGRPYLAMEDLARRTAVPTRALEALSATANAFARFGLSSVRQGGLAPGHLRPTATFHPGATRLAQCRRGVCSRARHAATHPRSVVDTPQPPDTALGLVQVGSYEYPISQFGQFGQFGQLGQFGQSWDGWPN